MTSFSIGAAWDETIGFLRRESGLLVPVSMATFGVAAVLLSFALPTSVESAEPRQIGSQALLILPVMLLLALGNMALTLLALIPGISVAEALRRAVMRLPVLVGAISLLGLIMCVALLVIMVVMAALAGNTAATVAIVLPIAFMLGLVLGVPMLLLSPVVAMERWAAIGALRRVLELVRGNVSRLFAIVCIMMLVTVTISGIATIVISALARLLALLMGEPTLIALIGSIVMAAISALLSMVNATYVAFAYRELAA